MYIWHDYEGLHVQHKHCLELVQQRKRLGQHTELIVQAYFFVPSVLSLNVTKVTGYYIKGVEILIAVGYD